MGAADLVRRTISFCHLAVSHLSRSFCSFRVFCRRKATPPGVRRHHRYADCTFLLLACGAPCSLRHHEHLPGMEFSICGAAGREVEVYSTQNEVNSFHSSSPDSVHIVGQLDSDFFSTLHSYEESN